MTWTRFGHTLPMSTLYPRKFYSCQTLERWLTHPPCRRYIVVWKGDRFVSTRQPPWTTTAIDILEKYGEDDDDRRLAILARLSTLFSEASSAVNGRDGMEVRDSQLILVGLSQQYQQVRDSLSFRFPGILSECHSRHHQFWLTKEQTKR